MAVVPARRRSKGPGDALLHHCLGIRAGGSGSCARGIACRFYIVLFAVLAATRRVASGLSADHPFQIPATRGAGFSFVPVPSQSAAAPRSTIDRPGAVHERKKTESRARIDSQHAQPARDLFLGRLARWFRLLADWRKQGRRVANLQARRRERPIMETLEPRVMLSADAYAAAGGGAHDIAVKIVDVDGTTPTLQVTDNGAIKVSHVLSSGDPYDLTIKRVDAQRHADHRSRLRSRGKHPRNKRRFP